MGVKTLWGTLEPAAQWSTLLELSLEAFNKVGIRGIRLGCDASLWLFHARKMAQDPAEEVGRNADLRVLLYRVLGLMRDGVLPLFVFDGPQKPKWKRGAHVGGGWGGSKHRDFQRLLDLLGMPWRIAAGEGEAELAAMARRGEIDGVLSDDVDTLLFTTPLLIRSGRFQNHSSKSSATQRPPPSPVKQGPSSSQPSSSLPSSSPTHPIHDDAHQLYYSDVIAAELGLEVEDLIFCALVSGGDYHPGSDSLGMKAAQGLSELGYAKQLLDGIVAHQEDPQGRADFIQSWKASVAEELRTNSQGKFTSRRMAAADKFEQDTSFPDLTVVNFYTNPAVSKGQPAPQWLADPDVPSLLEFLSATFEWGNAEIEQKCRNLLYPGLAMRELRQAALAADFSIPQSLSPSMFETIHERKTSKTTRYIDSYRVELSSEAFEILITSQLPSVDPFPIPLDPSQQVPGRRVKQVEEVKGTAPWRVWIPVEMVNAHPQAAKLASKFERRLEEKKLKSSPRKKASKGKSIATVFSSPAKTGVDGQGLAAAFTSSKGGVRKARMSSSKNKGKQKAAEPVTSTDEDEEMDLPLLKSFFSSRCRSKTNSPPVSESDSHAPPPPKSPRKSEKQVSAVKSRSEPVEIIELLDSDEDDAAPEPSTSTLKSSRASYSLSPPPRQRSLLSPAGLPSTSTKSSASLGFRSSKSTFDVASTKGAPVKSKSRSISIDSDDSAEEEALLLSSKEMLRQASYTSLASGASAKEGRRIGLPERKVKEKLPPRREEKVEILTLSDSDDSLEGLL